MLTVLLLSVVFITLCDESIPVCDPPCKDNEVCSIRRQECGPFTCDTYQVEMCPFAIVLDPPQCLCAPGFVWLSEEKKNKGCILASSCPMNITL